MYIDLQRKILLHFVCSRVNMFDEIDKLFLEDMGQQQEDFNHEMFASYQSNAIIGMIINWYKNVFSYSADYLNDQLVKILNVNRK